MDFHKIGKGGKPYNIIDDMIASYIIENEHITVIAGKPYIYKNGVYKKDEDGNILRYLIKSMILEELITINKINKVYQLIVTNHKLKIDIDDVNKHPSEWINFQNGFLDVRNMKMVEHSHIYLSINQIPHVFQMDRVVPGNSVVLEFMNGNLRPSCFYIICAIIVTIQKNLLPNHRLSFILQPIVRVFYR